MSDPTPKRRKTSPTTSIAVGIPEAESGNQSGPSTTGRPSYQSPTKASLSRSHPTILARSPGRRGSAGKGRGLRQEVLLGQTQTENSINEPPLSSLETTQQNTDGGSDDGSVDAVDSGTETLATAVAHAFANPAQAPNLPRSPLRPRQPSARSKPGNKINPGQASRKGLTSNLEAATAQGRDFPERQSATAEPDLPPTPTQLGLSPKPDLPRGLAASSSPSSRGSRRSRLRSGQVSTSSPLKSRQKMPAARTEELSKEGPDAGLAEAAPENDLERPETASHTQHDAGHPGNESGVAEEFIIKRKIRDDLRTQLTRLQADIAHLETALNGSEDTEEHLDPSLLALLSTPNISCDPTFSTPHPSKSSTITLIKDPTALDINPFAFLRAFAPGDLHLTTTTKSSFIRGRLSQAHILNVSAPPPWPPHVFHAGFRVTCDVESRTIISITGANIRPRHGAGIKELRHWVEARLKNPLHKFDAGTLIWGLGMWWKEAVSRARFFHHIDVTKASSGKKTQTQATLYRANEAVKAADVQALIPYLGKSFVELIPAEPYSSRASTCEERKYRQPRLLLKWDLELDWAGEVHTEIGVAGTKVSAKGQEGLKEVFVELMRRNGLDEAVRQTLVVCDGGTAGKKRK